MEPITQHITKVPIRVIRAGACEDCEWAIANHHESAVSAAVGRHAFNKDHTAFYLEVPLPEEA